MVNQPDKQKYKKGDKVKVKYGHLFWSPGPDPLGQKMPSDWKLISYPDTLKGTSHYTFDTRPILTEEIAEVEFSYYEKYGGADRDHRYQLKFEKSGSIAWFNENIIIPEKTE